MNDTAEEWRPVVGWEGYYEVSSLGNVNTVARRCASRGGVGTKAVMAMRRKPQVDSKGYHRLCLRDGARRKSYRLVHQLVVEAFIGPIKRGHCPNHKDGNRINNSIGNLEVCTESENHLHRCRVLGRGRGETHNLAILTDAKVIAIRAKYALRTRDYGAAAALARSYGVSASVIYAVVHKKSWRHVNGPAPALPSSP